MKNMIFELSGETPSKKNSRINTRSGRSFPNKLYTKWHDEAVREIHYYLMSKKITPIEAGKKISITFTFFHGDLKRRDSDNQCSSVLDTLIDAGIIPDDNWKVVPRKLIIDEYDKGNPHCLIKIEEL